VNPSCRFYFARLAAKTNFEAIMTWKEKIIQTLRNELEPLGFRYLKSMTDFRLTVDKNTTLYLGLVVDRYWRGTTDISLVPSANYRDIEEVVYQLFDISVAKYGRCRIGSRVEWLMPKEQYMYGDLDFRDCNDEKSNNKKMDMLLYRLKTYALPFLERLSHRESALEETISLDRKWHLFQEGIVPVMYCLWKHDKKSALDYLEEKRLRLLEMVEPWEWDLLERFKNGERFGGVEIIENGIIYGGNDPGHAYDYDVFLGHAKKIKEWINNQTY